MNKQQFLKFLNNLTKNNFSKLFLESSLNIQQVINSYKKYFNSHDFSIKSFDNITENTFKLKLSIIQKNKTNTIIEKWFYLLKNSDIWIILTNEEFIRDISKNWKSFQFKKITVKFENKNYKITMNNNIINEEFEKIKNFTCSNYFPKKIYLLDSKNSLMKFDLVNNYITPNSIIGLNLLNPELLIKFQLQNCNLPNVIKDGISYYYNNFVSNNPVNAFNFPKNELNFFIKNLKKLHCSFNLKKSLNDIGYQNQIFLLSFVLKLGKINLKNNDYLKVFQTSFIKYLCDKYGIDKIAQIINNSITLNFTKNIKKTFNTSFFMLNLRWKFFIRYRTKK
jgi:hypothetical protein